MMYQPQPSIASFIFIRGGSSRVTQLASLLTLSSYLILEYHASMKKQSRFLSGIAPKLTEQSYCVAAPLSLSSQSLLLELEMRLWRPNFPPSKYFRLCQRIKVPDQMTYLSLTTYTKDYFVPRRPDNRPHASFAYFLLTVRRPVNCITIIRFQIVASLRHVLYPHQQSSIVGRGREAKVLGRVPVTSFVCCDWQLRRLCRFVFSKRSYQPWVRTERNRPGCFGERWVFV